MNLDFSAAMRQAAQLTRAQKLMEATRRHPARAHGTTCRSRLTSASRSKAPARAAAPARTASQISSETQTAVAVEPPPALRERSRGRRDGGRPPGARGGRSERS